MVLSLKKKRKLQRFFNNTFIRKNQLDKWVDQQGHFKDCDHDGYFVGSKKDRYGSNCVPWINAIALARASGKPLYHGCTTECFRFKDTVMHSVLLEFSSPVSDCPECNLVNREGWLATQTNELIDVSGQALPEYLESSGLKQELFRAFEHAAKKNEWSVDVDAGKSVCVHVRLDDMSYKTTDNKQAFIGEKGLQDLLLQLRQLYPAHEIMVVTSPIKQDIDLCNKVIEDSGISNARVIANKDMDNDLYVMMLSDVLILSRSTFSFVPALLHQGTEVYSYEAWLHLDELMGAHHASSNGSYLSRKILLLE